jgi:hypothetical protein
MAAANSGAAGPRPLREGTGKVKEYGYLTGLGTTFRKRSI